MNTSELYALADARGHAVVHMRLESAPSMEMESGIRCYIALDTRLRGRMEKQCLAHGLGHCEYGGFYNRHSKYDVLEKAERKADKWAYSRLLPVGKVREACKRGALETWEIAELFDVTCEYAAKAIAYYRMLGLI